MDPSLTSQAPVSFHFDEVAWTATVSLDAELAAREQRVVEAILSHSQGVLDAARKAGSIEIGEVFEERLRLVWKHLRADSTLPPITLVVAQGAPSLPGFSVLPPLPEGERPRLRIEAGAEDIEYWKPEWTELWLRHLLARFKFELSPNSAHLEAIVQRARNADGAHEAEELGESPAARSTADGFFHLLGSERRGVLELHLHALPKVFGDAELASLRDAIAAAAAERMETHRFWNARLLPELDSRLDAFLRSQRSSPLALGIDAPQSLLLACSPSVPKATAGTSKEDGRGVRSLLPEIFPRLRAALAQESHEERELSAALICLASDCLPELISEARSGLDEMLARVDGRRRPYCGLFLLPLASDAGAAGPAEKPLGAALLTSLLRELVGLDAFQGTVDWISRRLRLPCPRTVVENTFNHLAQVGFITRGAEEGTWKRKHDMVVTEELVGGASVLAFYHDVLDAAEQLLVKKPGPFDLFLWDRAQNPSGSGESASAGELIRNLLAYERLPGRKDLVLLACGFVLPGRGASK